MFCSCLLISSKETFLLEKEITQSDTITHYLDDFFKKLTFDKALHYNKLTGDIN